MYQVYKTSPAFRSLVTFIVLVAAMIWVVDECVQLSLAILVSLT